MDKVPVLFIVRYIVRLEEENGYSVQCENCSAIDEEGDRLRVIGEREREWERKKKERQKNKEESERDN